MRNGRWSAITAIASSTGTHRVASRLLMGNAAPLRGKHGSPAGAVAIAGGTSTLCMIRTPSCMFAGQRSCRHWRASSALLSRVACLRRQARNKWRADAIRRQRQLVSTSLSRVPSATRRGRTDEEDLVHPPPQLNRIHESESRGFKEFQKLKFFI